MLRLVGYALLTAACVALLAMLLALSSNGVSTFSTTAYGVGFRALALRGQSLLALFELSTLGSLGPSAVEGFTSALDVRVSGAPEVALQLFLPPPSPANLTRPLHRYSPEPVLVENLSMRGLTCYVYEGRTYRSRVEPLLGVLAGDWESYDLLERVLGLSLSEVKAAVDPAGGYVLTLRLGNDTAVLCALEFDASIAEAVFDNGTRVPFAEFLALTRGAGVKPVPPFFALFARNVEVRAYMLFRPTPVQIARALALLATGAVLVALDALLTGSPPFLFLHKLRRILRRRGT
jgi:hypothetical protein